MQFELDEQQRQIQDLARQFARREIMPLAADADRKAELPEGLQEKAVALGLANINLPESVGGAGLGCMELVLVTEALCHACLGIGTALCVNALALEPIVIAGTPEQQTRYLGLAVKGALAGFAMTEPGAGSDVAGIRTRAERVPGGYELSGSKLWISNATHAAFFVVFAKTDPQGGHRGITAFIVPRDSAGLRVGQPLGNWANVPLPLPKCFSSAYLCRTITGWVMKAAASRLPWRCSIIPGPWWRRLASALPNVALTNRWPMRANAAPWAARSSTTRPSPTNWRKCVCAWKLPVY